MTTHPTPPDQTAAAQEREALIWARDFIDSLNKEHAKYVPNNKIEVYETISKALDDALSTQQPEPCVDVENNGPTAQKEGDRG